MDALFFSCLVFTMSISLKKKKTNKTHNRKPTAKKPQWNRGAVHHFGARASWYVMGSISTFCHASGEYSIHNILLSMYLEKNLLYFQLSNQERIFFFLPFQSTTFKRKLSYLFENSVRFWKQKRMKSATVGLRATLILIM